MRRLNGDEEGWKEGLNIDQLRQPLDDRPGAFLGYANGSGYNNAMGGTLRNGNPTEH